MMWYEMQETPKDPTFDKKDNFHNHFLYSDSNSLQFTHSPPFSAPSQVGQESRESL